MTIYVSMLRAVNVGGSSRLKMDALRAVYESLGLADVRTLLQSGSIVERGPVLSPRADSNKLLVMFLASVPDAAAQAALVKWHKSKEMKEMLEMRGPEIYLYYPDGIGRSKLTSAVIEGKLDIPGTARNWNTLTKLVENGRALEHADRARR